MDIEINESKHQIQKFILLPQLVKIPARQILDQMLKFDIIRECNKPPWFCSNLLATKKKKEKSKICMLLDGRLIENATIRLPICYPTQLEILNHLSGRDHVTTMDISQVLMKILG
jgi:hypothetical protein